MIFHKTDDSNILFRILANFLWYIDLSLFLFMFFGEGAKKIEMQKMINVNVWRFEKEIMTIGVVQKIPKCFG